MFQPACAGFAKGVSMPTPFSCQECMFSVLHGYVEQYPRTGEPWSKCPFRVVRRQCPVWRTAWRSSLFGYLHGGTDRRFHLVGYAYEAGQQDSVMLCSSPYPEKGMEAGLSRLYLLNLPAAVFRLASLRQETGGLNRRVPQGEGGSPELSETPSSQIRRSGKEDSSRVYRLEWDIVTLCQLWIGANHRNRRVPLGGVVLTTAGCICPAKFGGRERQHPNCTDRQAGATVQEASVQTKQA